MKLNTINLYGCGGSGVNLVAPFIEGDVLSGNNFAEVRAVCIDTSTSNLINRSDEVRSRAFYQIKLSKDDEGSGKVRAENASDITRQVPNILTTYAPADLNIVVCSAAGGSGSVIAPLLHAELVRQGHAVISLVVTDEGSTREMINTSNTLLSYDSLAKKQSTPFVVGLFSNDLLGGRQHTNRELTGAIASLASLFSGKNLELDMTDLKNFINFMKGSRNPNVGAGVAQLDIFYGNDEKLATLSPVSVAMLHPSEEDRERMKGKFMVEYIAEGFYPDNTNITETTVHVISYNNIIEFMERLKKTIDANQRHLAGSMNTGTAFELDAEISNQNDTGLVL